MTISPLVFADRMEQHWTSTLQNETSPALKKVWSQMAHVFGQKILEHGKSGDQIWRVLQPPTGTGKSQGLALYSAMLASQNRTTELNPVGVLIVVRLKTQADAIADTINTLAGFDCAAAHHGDNRLTVEEMKQTDVLIITHKAYELAVDEVNQQTQAQWANVGDWVHGPRKLVVIDEALDIVNHEQLDLDGLRQVIGQIPYEIAQSFPKQMEALEFLRDVFQKVSNKADEATLADPMQACSRAPKCAEDYVSKISGPMLDRIDIFIDVPAVSAADLTLPPAAEGSAEIAARVLAARERQAHRYKAFSKSNPVRTNAAADGEVLEAVAAPDDAGRKLLTKAIEQMRLTARGYHRVLRVARTLADLSGAETIQRVHIAEALSYRRLPNYR